MIKYGRKLLSSILAASMVLGSASATIGATAVQVFADEAPAPIVSIAGETLGATTVIEEGYAYTGWGGAVTTGPLYMYTIPAGTTAVDIDFTDNVLAYNYGSVNSSDDDYICGWFADFMTGASTGTFDVDHDNNGVLDYIQVQTPYDEDWNTSILYGIGFEYAEEPEVSNTCAMEISSIMRDTGKPSGMYTFENAIVTAQEDGTYLVRFHQYNANRNVIALTDDKDAAKAHEVDWYIGGGADGYWFTIPVASLEEPIYAVMSSESRIAAGNDFSNVIVITLDPATAAATEEAPAVAEDMNISPAVVASTTHAIEVSSIMRDTGKPSGMYTFEGAIVTEQEDGTYLVRMHQANANRNVIALTDDKDAAKDHAVAWYIGGGADGYWFTIPVASLDEPVYAVMSSESRIAAGNDFSNVIVITFDAESMTDTEEAPAVAEDMNISPAVPPVPVEIVTPYTVTANNTGMFKVVDAYMKEVDGTKTLYITLNGTGYHSLYKGTYEEAVATANDMDLWINGVIREDETEFNGKYEFAIPVEDGDSYMQINARSFSKGTWYPRYILIDQTAATLESGDYAEEFALTVTNQNDAAVASAKMNVTAGPNSNNYLVTATVEIPGYVQAYIGNAADAAAATEGCIDVVEGAFTIPAEKLITPGSPAVDTILEQPTAVSFKDEAGNWAEYTLTISKAHRTLTADYQKPVTAIVAQPVDCTVKMGATASFKVEAENAVSYQWYYSKDGVKWMKSTLSKATTPVLSFKASAVNENNQYKCVVTGACGDSVTSDIVKVVVLKAAVITKDPEQVVAAKGDAISFKVEAENAVSYQWYYSKDGVKWSKSTLSTAASTEIAIKVSDSNAMNVYRCKVTGEDGSAVISESAGITLKQPAVIVAQPVDSTAKMGKSATFKVEAENAVSYQWYYSKDGVKWVKSTLSSATSATLKFTVSDKNIDNKYRCKVTGEDGKSINTTVVGIAK